MPVAGRPDARPAPRAACGCAHGSAKEKGEGGKPQHIVYNYMQHNSGRSYYDTYDCAVTIQVWPQTHTCVDVP